MPNWCENRLIAEGDRALDFKEGFLKSGFSDAVPMPKDLMIESGYPYLSYFEKIAEARGKKDIKKEKKIWGEIEKENIGRDLIDKYLKNYENFGFPTWYEWRIANWGTKWNVCEEDIHIVSDIGNRRIEFSFDTAWSPPISWLAKASKIYDLKMDLFFSEPMMMVLGRAVFDKGKKSKLVFIDDFKKESAKKIIDIYDGDSNDIEKYFCSVFCWDEKTRELFEKIWEEESDLLKKVEKTIEIFGGEK